MTTQAVTSTALDPQTTADLNIARGLAEAGTPVFVAYPDPEGLTESGRRTGYRLPSKWETTTANPAYVAGWKPGCALVAVMGRVVDLVDDDPRNRDGGSPAELGGLLPDVIGVASTPSGGIHLFVRSMGVRSHDGVLPGIDVKAGTPDGGTGFAFIAPTVRKSKTTGEPGTYKWIMPPDLSLPVTGDPAGSKLAELVRQAHGSRKQPSGTMSFQQPSDTERRHAGPIPYGEHHKDLVAYAGWLRARNLPIREAEACMLMRLGDLVQPPGAQQPRYTEDEALAELHDVYTRYAAGDAAAEDAAEPGSQAARQGIASGLLSGGVILDVPKVPETVWGDEDNALWGKGQSLIIAGPDGVGKTTLSGNLIRGRLGLGTGEVLGVPVQPGERNVLILLMDRPVQAMASLARLFAEADRAVLDARLRVWRGPPPQDLARFPNMLTELCAAADADTCVVDSLKDAAVKLSDDETGSGWNRARQTAIEAGTELLELHHPRKEQVGNKRPSELADLYGSRFIPAGAGSVICLWGKAGDPVVELTHIKPLTVPVGPWQMNINGDTGLVTAHRGTDLVEQIRLRGDHGINASTAAAVLAGDGKVPSRSDVERARRKLNKLTDAGKLVCLAGHAAAGAGSTWFLASHSSHASSHAPSGEPPVTASVTQVTDSASPQVTQSRTTKVEVTPTEEPVSHGNGGLFRAPFRDWPPDDIPEVADPPTILGPCVRCYTPCNRYGADGSPLCDECKARQEQSA